MNLQQISYIIGYPSVVFPLTFCRLQSYWRSIRADDFGSIYDEKTVTQMQFEFYNTLPIEAWPYYQLDLIQEIKYTSRACNDEITVPTHLSKNLIYFQDRMFITCSLHFYFVIFPFSKTYKSKTLIVYHLCPVRLYFF